LANGDIVVVIGRRRRASYARIHVDKKLKKSKKTVANVSANLATNLRVRQQDTIKLVPLIGNDPKEARPGELVLLQTTSVSPMASITLNPVEDSLFQLQAAEGGDEISDDELTKRFLNPYFAAASSDDNNMAALLKTNCVLALTDASGRTLEFMVTNIQLESTTSDDEPKKKKDADSDDQTPVETGM
jgi:hypothetical protein